MDRPGKGHIIEFVEAEDGDWLEVWIDGDLFWAHHNYATMYPKLLARLGFRVLTYSQPLDKDGWLEGTRDQRSEPEEIEDEENPY